MLRTMPLIGSQEYLLHLNNIRTSGSEIFGPINYKILKYAVEQVLQRHFLLCSRILNNQHGARIEIIPFDDFITRHSSILTIEDFSDQFENINENAVDKVFSILKSSERQHPLGEPFNLSTGPLAEFYLSKIGEDHHTFCFIFHHIIGDETSINIIMHDLSHFYNAKLNHEPSTLISLPDISTLNFTLPDTVTQQRLEYFQNKLKGISPPEIITDTHLPPAFDFAGDRLDFEIENDIIENINNIIEETKHLEKFTTNQIFNAAFLLAIWSITLNEEICIGFTSANRIFPDITNTISNALVNCFFNSLPLRVKIPTEGNFIDLLKLVKAGIIGPLKNQLPANEIYLHALSSEDKNKFTLAALFTIMLVVNSKLQKLNLAHTESTYPQQARQQKTQLYDWGVNLNEQEDGTYSGFLEFNTHLYKIESMQHFLDRFKKILRQLINPTMAISDISFLSDAELSAINAFNHTEKQEMFTGFFPDIFHQLAQEHADKAAIIYHEHKQTKLQISYKELDRLSTLLCNCLKEQGIAKGTLVGYSLSSSIELYILKLAIQKVGAVEVPLETEGSNEFFSEKIQHLNLQFIIGTNETTQLFNGFEQVKLLNIQHKEFFNFANSASEEYQSPKLSPTDLAYIIFTSATTAKNKNTLELKAVKITHQALRNLCNEFAVGNYKVPRLLSTSLPTFDAIYFDMAWAFIKGGSIHPVPKNSRYSIQPINNIIDNQAINAMVITPYLLALNEDVPVDVLVMGAVAKPEDLNRWAAREAGEVIIGYGLTESGVCATLRRYFKAGDNPHFIGQPINNVKIYVVQNKYAQAQVCGLRTPGEIWISGEGVTAGYFDTKKNDQKLIRKKYDSDTGKFHDCEEPEGEIIFCTGDYGCFDTDRNKQLNLRFIARAREDGITKINQLNIHLPSIEKAILEYNRIENVIQDVCVVPNTEATAVVAGLVFKYDCNIEEITVKLKTFLTEKFPLFPSSALPRFYVALDKIPLSNNGKRIATYDLLKSNYLPPQNVPKPNTAMQLQLHALWSKILDIPDINIQDPFKYLGGNSLSLAQISRAINTSLRELFPEDFFSALEDKVDSYTFPISKLSFSMSIESLEKILLTEQRQVIFKYDQKKYSINPSQNEQKTLLPSIGGLYRATSPQKNNRAPDSPKPRNG